MRRRDIAPAAAIYAGYGLVSLIFLLPLLWVVSLSLRPLEELFAFPPNLLPQHPTLDAYGYVLQNSPIVTYLLNSLRLVAITLVGAFALALPAAYAMSRLRFRSAARRQAVLLGILAVQLISPLVTALPLYRYFSRFGLIDSTAAVAVVYIALQAPFATWVLTGFVDTVPRALDDAARIDGCSRLQTLTHVLLPVLLPGIASTAIMIAIATWGQFLMPFVLLSKDQLYPVAVGILQFQSSADAVSTHHLAAVAVLSVLPAILIFLVLQRFIIGALTAGAVKG